MSAPAVPGPELLALQQAIAGRYSLVRELGRGGMGMVFLARGGAEGGMLEAVSALEAIRLDLLRVSVQQLSPAELTAELQKVREMGAAVDRRLDAVRDVDALLAARDLTPAERPPLSMPSRRTPAP